MINQNIDKAPRRWHKPLTLAIKQEQRDVERHIPSIDRQTYGPYLALLDADVLGGYSVLFVTQPNVPAATIAAVKAWATTGRGWTKPGERSSAPRPGHSFKTYLTLPKVWSVPVTL